MSTVSSLSLLTLPVEILFAVFKLLDRPSKLSLSLTSPHFLHHLASYYDLERYRERYRSDERAQWKFGIPEGAFFRESVAQPAIIRWLACPGGDDIENPPQVEEGCGSPALDLNDTGEFGDFAQGLESPVPYEKTEEGVEDVMVENIISDWLRAKFNISGGCILCAECCRYMLVLGPDGKITPWVENMLTRPTWIRHCGPCGDSCGISRGAVLT